MSPIGTLQENSLHASLKAWYAIEGDQIETQVDGFWIDLRRGDQLFEIQTGNFSALKRKLERLLPAYPVRVIYPLAREKWILRIAIDNGLERVLARRKSPRRGQPLDMFNELVRIASFLTRPNFSLEVLHIQQEDVWLDDGKGSWRRKGVSVVDRRLVGVLERDVFTTPHAYRRFPPPVLPPEFTTRELAARLGVARQRAARVAYTLRATGALAQIGKRGHSNLYRILD